MQTPSKPISQAAQSLIAAIENCRGQFAKCAFTSTVKGAAAHKDKALTKETVGVFRSGIDYANLKTVKDGIASGERGEVESLPWGEWALFPFIIVHKESEYLRLYPVPNAAMEVTYKVDGVEVDKATFQSYLTPSQCAEKDAPACITKKLAEIRFMGCWEAPAEQEGCESCQ
jgi:hypothetical protein